MSSSDPTKFLRFDDWRSFFTRGLQALTWQTVYENIGKADEDGLIYSALIPNASVSERLKDYSWDLKAGSGYPGNSQSGHGKELKTTYDRLGFLEGVEPLVICRTFHSGSKSFREISEEFRLFHNLYQGKNREEFIKDDKAGNPEIVARILPDKVEIRTKEIRQFLAIKEMHLAIQVDINRRSLASLEDYQGGDHDEVLEREDASYHWGVQGDKFREPYRTHARFLGKKLLAPLSKEESGEWPFSEEEESYPAFIIGRDDQGNDVEFTCDESKLKNYFGANPEAPHYLTPVHFREDVLTKYYNHPDRYSVEDGYLRAGSLWGLKMDNDHIGCVVVFLGDLGRDLPEAERDYWRSFNIPPDNPALSKTAFTRSIRGWFADPVRPDLAFKDLFPYFCEKWREEFGWDLFLPLSKNDAHHLTTVRIPIHNDQGEFDAQVQSLTKLIVDSLNETELSKGLTLPGETKGISKFQAFLENRSVSDSAVIILFLRNLQTLRSTGVAHRKGSNYEKIAKVFDLENREFKDVASELFASAHKMLRTLGRHFIPKHDWGDDKK